MKSSYVLKVLIMASLVGQGLSGCGDSNFVTPAGLGATEVNQPPEIVLGSEVRAFDASKSQRLAPNLTVSDDQPSLRSGVLSLSLSDGGDVTDVIFEVPDGSPIGSVEGDKTSHVRVELETGASPSAIQEFLRSVSVSRGPGGQSGAGVIELVLTDGRGGTENLQVSFESVISVGPNGDEATVADALQTVNDTRSTGAFIDVAEGHVETSELSITSGAQHDGLTLRGVDSGKNVGTHASIRSSLGSTLDSIRIDAENVTVDGFNLFTGGTTCIELTGRSQGVTVKNCAVIYNGSPQPDHYGIHAPSPSDPTIEDCRLGNWDIGLFLDGTPTEPVTEARIISNGFVRCNTGMLLQEPLGEFSLVIRSNGHSQNAESHVEVTGTNPTRLFLSTAEYLTDDPVIIDGPITVEAERSWWGADAPPTSPDQFQELNGGDLRFDPIATRRLFPGFVP